MAVSGQIGVSAGAIVDGGVAGQTRQALANLVTVLATEGATLAQVVKTTVYLRDIHDFAAMNDVYADVFGECRPARATVGVAGLPLAALVEVDAWAYVG
ncbi:MAG: 2-iminobutanoate/2-iminopropanoate deaminase [Actinomycetota bacterium]|nr:2-iminobutanoate/2-iminopropanoate deaminase [Actinomycetota bacterium]